MQQDTTLERYITAGIATLLIMLAVLVVYALPRISSGLSWTGGPRCDNAEGDSVPCAWLRIVDCNEACQRKKCKEAGKHWQYTDSAQCRLKYFSSGGPDIAFTTDTCGHCEGN